MAGAGSRFLAWGGCRAILCIKGKNLQFYFPIVTCAAVECSLDPGALDHLAFYEAVSKVISLSVVSFQFFTPARLADN